MQKTNFLGIREKAILNRSKGVTGYEYVVMRPITKKIEHELDTDEKAVLPNGASISRKSIYIYGVVDVTNPDDIGIIKKFNLLDDSDKGNIVPSGFDYLEGVAHHDGVIKYKPTWDVVEWFKYNYCLIGKPERIVIFQCSKSSL